MVSLGHFDFDFDFPLGKGLWEGKPYHAGCLNDTSPSRPQTAVPEGCSLLLQSQPKSSGWGQGLTIQLPAQGRDAGRGLTAPFADFQAMSLHVVPLYVVFPLYLLRPANHSSELLVPQEGV